MTIPDAGLIRCALSGVTAEHLGRIDTFDEVDSTNTWLCGQPPPPARHVNVAVAGHQTSGRGRHDRAWLSAPDSGLCLSLSYTFGKPPELLPPLTLAMGVRIADALGELGIRGVKLKWPNDLLIEGAKLGGILTESLVGKRNAVTVVAGIGINIDLPEDLAATVRSGWAQRPIALADVTANPPSRELLAGKIVDALLGAFTLYDEQGFSPFEPAFVAVDWLRGKSIVVETVDGELGGIAAGIDSDGALLMQGANGLQRIVSGSIRLRETPAMESRAV